MPLPLEPSSDKGADTPVGGLAPSAPLPVEEAEERNSPWTILQAGAWAETTRALPEALAWWNVREVVVQRIPWGLRPTPDDER